MKNITNLFFVFAFLFFSPKGHSITEILEFNDCVSEIANGQIDCTEYLPNGNLRIVANNNNVLTEYEIDENGATVQSQELGLAVDFTLEIENNEIVKRDASGNIISQQAINASLFGQYFSFEKVIEFDGGYVIAAYENERVDWDFDPGLTLIKTDLNTNALNTFFIESEGEPVHAFVHNLVKIENNRFAIIVNQQPEQHYPQTNFYLFDAAFDLKFEKTINIFNQGYTVFPNAELRQTACGYWYYRRVNGSENCNYSCVISRSNTYFNFENDEIVNYKGQGTSIGSLGGDPSLFIPTKYISNYGSYSPYIDGGELRAYYNSNIPQAFYPPNPYSGQIVPASISYKLVHLDSNGDTLWQKTPDDLFDWVEFIKIGDNYFLLDGDLVDDMNNPIILTQVSESCPTVGNTCSEEITGFTFMGEFENSKYFLSDDISAPMNAQTVAQQNDGYLAVVSSQAENDFLQQHISEMTYIGLNDVDAEGDLVWENGEPLTYNNINPCSFCNANSDNQDYIIMAYWDGAWSFSNEWSQRKYIIEIPCNGSANNLPDVTLLDPYGLPSSLQTGEYEQVYFKIKNIGTAPVYETTRLKIYLSLDELIDSGDVLLGEKNAGPAPIDAQGIAQFSFHIPSVISENYFVIIIADAEETIAELDETNNSLVIPVEIFSTIVEPTSLTCDYENSNVETGELLCYDYSDDGKYSLTLNTSDGVETFQYKADGSLNYSVPVTIEYEKYAINNNTITKTNQDGLEILNIPFSSGITDQFSVAGTGYAGVAPADNNTFIVMAYERTSNVNTSGFENGFDDLFALNVDANGNLLNQMLVETINFGIEINEYHGMIPAENGGGTLIYKQRQYEIATIFEMAIGNDLSILDIKEIAKSTREFATPSPIGPYLTISHSPCSPNSFLYMIDASTNGSNGSDNSTFHFEILKEFKQPISSDIYWFETLLANLTGLFVNKITRKFKLPNGGGTLEIKKSVSMYLNNPPYGQSKITRYTVSGDVLWEEDFEFNLDNMPVGVLENTDGGLIFIYEENGTIVIASPNCDSNQNCPNEIAGFTLLGEFGDSKYFLSNDNSAPANAQAVAQQNGGFLAVISSQSENDFLQQNISEMTYIGLNDVDTEGNLVWENGDPLNYNNINPCSFCNENSDEQDYVIIAPWDGAWSFSNVWNSRKYIVEIPCGPTLMNPNVNNFMITPTKIDIETEQLSLEKLHPNPTMDFIFATIQSSREQRIEMQIFDARGVLNKEVSVSLIEGENIVEFATHDLSEGMYFIFIPDALGKNTTMNFIKIKE